MRKVRMVIIGSGPAGLTAALYASRAQLSTIVIAGDKIGGQIATTSEVDNFPGFPEGIMGPELAERMQKQAERFGAEFIYDMVTEVDFSKGSPFPVKTYDETYLADAVVITIGATPRELNVPGEREYVGRGVSYCATCDGFFFKGKEVAVVGGGDSALQEALFLTKFATSVKVIHRRDSLRASTALQTRAFANDKISFIWDTTVEAIKAENNVVNALTLKNVKTGEIADRPFGGVFIFIGHDPNSDVFNGQLATDENGYLLIDQLMRTNVEGVFAGGEIGDHLWKQAITSAGQGCAAAMSAIKWLEERESAGILQPLDSETVPAAGD